MQGGTTQRSISVTTPASTHSSIAIAEGILALLFPVILIALIIGYRKHRSTVRRRRRERLEKLWLLNSDAKVQDV